jgi:O-methyltransferase involved in polyketide biosynthesis
MPVVPLPCPPAADAASAPPGGADIHALPLPPVPSTLLIPLAARAHGGRYFPQLDCGDAQAAQLLQQLGTDVSPYLADRPTLLNVLWRTRRIRAAAQAFFTVHPQSWGVNLGCGLSQYRQWLEPATHWLDADLPAVMALRRRLLPAAGPQQHSASIDLQAPGWWPALQLPPEALAQPLFVLCEGVLMYLTPAQVRQVLQEFADHAPPGSRLVLDAIAHCGVGQAGWHASVGRTGAQFHWGIGCLGELTRMHPRLHLHSSYSVAECYGWLGLWLEALWRPWIGAPLYTLAVLEVI